MKKQFKFHKHLFSGQIQNLTLEQVDVAFEGVPTVETEENEMNILDV